MKKVLGLGHSHVVAIAKGCYELQNKRVKIGGAPFTSRFLYLYDPEIMPTVVIEDDQPRLNAKLAGIIEQERPAAIFLSIGGNEHIAVSVVQSNERIDFILGENPDLALEPGATVLTEAAVRETMRDKMEPTLSTISAIREATNAPLVCFEPPPPLPDSQILAYPKEFFRKSFDADKLSTELFRYKTWRVQSWLYREICARHKIVFVPVPDEFITPSGLLAQEAWGGDATHANVLFGKAIIERAIRVLGAQ